MRRARVRKGHAVLRGGVSLVAAGAACLTTAVPGQAVQASQGVRTSLTAQASSRHAPAPVRAFAQHQWFTAEQGVAHPLAVTVLDRSGLLAVADRTGGRTRVTLLDPARDRVVGRMRVAGIGAARTLADDGRGTLAVLAGRQLLTWPASARGAGRPHATRIAGSLPARPAGMSWDPAVRGWLVLDAAGHRLVRLTGTHGPLRASGGPGLGTPAGVRLRGLAVDAASGLVYVGTERGRLYEVTGTGHVRRTFTVAGDQGAGALASGPSADPTDPAGVTSLYAAAAGSTAGSHLALGRVSELSLTPLGSAAALAPSVATSTATLVRKTLLSQLSPPSPDPSGIVYQSDVGRLFVVDSEVDEMSIYRSVNMWQLSLSGSTLYNTGNTLKFSKEPTGVGYDPVGKRMFISDDDKGRVFQVTAGPDGRLGTADDVVTSFSTTAFGDDDAEDVTYDTRDKALYVTQGVGQEVWRVAPGPDGRFDGVAPTGDDQVTHFDTAV